MSFIIPRETVSISDFEENKPWSQFSELLTVDRYPLIELNSAYGKSQLRDITTEINSGTVTSSNGEIVVSTGTTSNAVAAIRSVATGRYQPGYAAETGIGIRIPTIPTGDQEGKWGTYTEDNGGVPNNGFYFGIDSTGVFVARARNGVETLRQYQSDWNIDPADGNGPSGYTLDVTTGLIYQVDFTWYGYGIILFTVVDQDSNGNQRRIYLHRDSFPGETSVTNPNLPVTTRVTNSSTAADFTIFVGGRQYSITGNYSPAFRITSEYRISADVTTDFTPLISFQYKNGFEDRAVRLEGFSVTSDGGTGLITQIRWNSTLTGTNFQNPNNHLSNETALQADTAATAMSGGHTLYEDLLPGGDGTGPGGSSTAANLDSLDMPIAPAQPIVLSARTFTGSDTVTAVFRMKEEW